MIDSQTINELVDNIVKALPRGVQSLPRELEKNLHQLIENQCHKLNLVTREEFDAQAGVLLRTREKLEQLEQKIQELE